MNNQNQHHEHHFTKSLKSNLSRFQPKPFNAEKIKREGWNKDSILVIKADDERLTWPEQELIKQIGNRIYSNKNSANHDKQPNR